ncbi:MAG: class I SAM-dependent methyltransferase [Melioribacteraceae bacterium]|jgi:ubiquinone/menaquinone biosynthesis C-methylase UbiE|nr:class I SAM-dependent methyltransferase [Melioribacteraceae bacterium]
MSNIFLPGLGEQIEFLFPNLNSASKILVLGSESSEIAERLKKHFNAEVEIVVEDYESLINTNLQLSENKSIKAKLMEFDHLDYKDNQFDLIYSQGSISLLKRNKIIKEIKRVLIPNGHLYVGEIVKLQQNVPQFVEDIFEQSFILPLFIDDLHKYYEERNFELAAEKNLTYTLKRFYSETLNKIKEKEKELTDKEKSYYKKLINKINHEAKSFLRSGADKHIGFYSLLLKKK